MKILFVTQGCLPFHKHTLEQRPIGGTETGVIRLSDQLANLGHEVIVATSMLNPPLTDPLYIPLTAVSQIKNIDLLIAVRDWQPLLLNLNCEKKFYWTGDSYDQLANFGIGDPRIAERCHGLLAVSHWQADQLATRSGFPKERIVVIGNGVHLPYFAGSETKEPFRLIYSSTPYRGLAHLPEIYRQIKNTVPQTELHIFSGFKVYAGLAEQYPDHVLREFEEVTNLLSTLPGVVLHGNILQKQLAREFMKSSILCYPNTFAETSCITALEARAAGCLIVTSNLAALPETVNGCGVLIDPPATSARYRQEFAEACSRLLTDPEYRQPFLERSLSTKAQLGWDTVVEKLLHFVNNLLP